MAMAWGIFRLEKTEPFSLTMMCYPMYIEGLTVGYGD
jgi:hypothetical protein